MSANRARRRARQAAVEATKADGNRLPAAQKAGGVTFTPEQAVALARAGRDAQISTIAKPLPQALVGSIPFGPGMPLPVAPINAPRTDSGRAEPRQYEYPQSWNLPGFSDRLVPWAVLRAAADQIPLIRQCIEIRKNEVATLNWDVRISKDAIQLEMQRSGGSRQDVHTEMMKRLAPDIQRLKAFWEEPDKRNGHDFAAWANKFLEEHFVLDAVAIYPRMTRGGDPYALEIIDGSTIKPLLDEYGHRPLPPQPAYQQVLHGFPRGEFIADAVEGLGADGQVSTTISGAYPSDRLVYLVHNTRTTSPYGYSAVEQALIDGDLWLRRHGWIKAEYTDGVMPSGWLEAGPGQADWSPDQLTIYGDALNEYLAGDTKARQRFRILPYGMKPSDQTQAPERYKPDFDMFLLKLVARHLDTTIAELGFTEQGGLGSTGWHEGQADVQERAGTGPTIRRIESWCTRIGRRFLASPPELEFVIVGDDEDEDATENKTWVEKTQAGGATLNEWRDEMGMPRYEFDEANKPFLVGAGGPIFLEGAIAKQEAQQAATDALTAAKAAGALPGVPGEPGAAPGPGDASKPGGGQAKAPGDAATKPDAPDTAKADEIRGYRRWRRRNSDRARPFEFAHHTLLDLAELGIDPAVDPVTVKADDPDLVKAGGTPKAPAPLPGPATWPGWEVDLALAQLYAETLSQGLTGAVPDGFVDSFISAVQAGTARSAILDWIERHGPAADVVDTVRSALADLYTEGYLVGDRSAVSVLTGAPADWGDWTAGRPGAARKLVSADGRQVGLQDLLDQAEVGIKSISANRLDELAGVLADGLDANQSPDEIARAVDGLFGDRQWAEMVTHTELSRAQTAASLDRYDEAGVGSTEWATAPDERVCEICQGNKAAGPVKLGERYPSGEYAPPGHPWCRCVILPTIDDDLFKVDYLVNLDIPEWVWAWDSSLHPRGPDGRFLPTMSGMRRLKERHVRAKAAGRDLTKLNDEIARRLVYWQGMATPVEVKPKREHPLAEYAFGRSSAGGSAHAPLNAALRGQTEHTDETRALQAGLDHQFEQAPPLTRSRKVYRVVSGDSRLRGQMISTAKDKGIWTEPGFMSSSKSRDVLDDFDVGGNRVELEITVPAGAKALDVDPHLDPNNPDHYAQGEVLLPRGTRLQFGPPTPQPGGGTLIKAKVVVDRPGGGPKPKTPEKPKPSGPRPAGPDVLVDGAGQPVHANTKATGSNYLYPGTKPYDAKWSALNGYLDEEVAGPLNTKLRRGGELSRSQGEMAAGLDSAIQDYKVAYDTEVYRGLRLPDAELAKWTRPGEQIADPAYFSTASSPDLAKRAYQFGDGSPAMVKIAVPAGTQAAPGLVDARNVEDGVGELIFGRGTRVQIDSAVKDDKGVWQVTAHMVPGPVVKADWDEAAHPRGAAGQWVGKLVADVKAAHPGVKLDLETRSGGHVVLSRIVTPQRSKGTGSKIMQQIVDEADRHGHTLALTPSGDYGGSPARLKKFYARFGFVPNKGRSRDLEISEDMLRLPQTSKADWDESLHPRGPGGRWVHGWSSHSRSDLVEETAKKVFDEARANPEASGWSDHDLMSAARDQAELDVSQSVKRELRHGEHKIAFETDVSDEDVHRTAATVNRLMKERPVDKLRLTVMADSRLPQHSHGETYRGGGIIRISDAAYRQDSADVESFMPARREHSNLDYVLAHEWGHTHDVHSKDDPVMIYEHFADLSPYGQTSPAEAYAEAYADFTLTGGGSTNPATRAYAEKYGWTTTEKTDEGPVGDFKARHLIEWFNKGADGKIPWGSPGDFDACVRIAGEHMSPEKAKGFCANRHHDATGEWPGPQAHKSDEGTDD